MKQSVALVDNFNVCIREMTGEWVWIQADDQIFNRDALLRLLDRELDVVVPIILKRNPPYHPVVFKDYDPDRGFLPYSLAELPCEGVLKVGWAGSGGMLLRRHVLEAISFPKDVPWEKRTWFTYGNGLHLNEDLVFCNRITEAGFDIHLDVEVQMGHRGTFTVLPVRSGDGWSIGLNMGPSSNGKSNTIVIDQKEE